METQTRLVAMEARRSGGWQASMMSQQPTHVASLSLLSTLLSVTDDGCGREKTAR